MPILQTKVPAERVTLSSSEPVPLRALWITNSSNLTLDRGSFSIVENGSFGGEGLLDPIHPGKKRLLSYAIDQSVRISTDSSTSTRKVLHLSIKGGLVDGNLPVPRGSRIAQNRCRCILFSGIRTSSTSGWSMEDKLAALRNELTALHAQRTAKDAEFQAKLNSVEVDEAL